MLTECNWCGELYLSHEDDCPYCQGEREIDEPTSDIEALEMAGFGTDDDLAASLHWRAVGVHRHRHRPAG